MKSKLNFSVVFILLTIFSKSLFGQTMIVADDCGYNTVGATGSVHNVYNPSHKIAGKGTASPGLKIMWIIDDPSDPYWANLEKRAAVMKCMYKVYEVFHNSLMSPHENYHVRIHLVFNDDVGSIGTKLGFCNVYHEDNFGAGCLTDKYYPISLANFLKCKNDGATGRTFNAGVGMTFDMKVNMNTTTAINWHFEPDLPCPSDKFDFTTTLLHEVLHGFGFTTGVYALTSTTAAFSGSPTIYDYYISNKKYRN